MLDPAVAARLLTEHYGGAATRLQVLRASPRAALVQVELMSGQRALLRLYDAAFPVHWFSDRPMPVWLSERANLLHDLERLNYPAPRLLPTLDGDPIASQAGWYALLLSYIEGLPADYSLPGLQLLGSTLGALHALPASPQLGRAWWHPDYAVPTALGWLDQAAGAVPARWSALYQTARRVLQEVAAASGLPTARIHADVWPENAIRSAPDQMTLIDWECAGWGPAVLDVGDLLLSAHYDTATITPNAARIAAVLAGYFQHHRLTTAEVAALPTAVHFSAVFHTALHFFRRIDEQWNEADTTRRLARDEARVSAGSGIAAAALAWIERSGPAERSERRRRS